jgi:hypothetical protein
MDVFTFKKRLQLMSGQSPDKYRAVEAIGDACAKLWPDHTDVVDIAMVLSAAADLYVQEFAPNDLLPFMEMQENSARRLRELYAHPDARRTLGIDE